METGNISIVVESDHGQVGRLDRRAFKELVTVKGDGLEVGLGYLAKPWHVRSQGRVVELQRSRSCSSSSSSNTSD